MNDATALLDGATRSMREGSRSFATATRLFDARTRESAVLLYAWCRHCDDVVDGQALGLQRVAQPVPLHERLATLDRRTHLACAGVPQDDPVFDGLAVVVRRHRLPAHLPLELLAGFAMDARGTHYATLADTLLYAWRVAGVVGVMMARVMGATGAQALDRACDLGLAFQLTNIARDVVEDARHGRVYLPADWLRAEGVLPEPAAVAAPRHRAQVARVAARLVQAAEPYYDSARAGLRELPWRCAWAVATARGVYRAIGHEVLRRGPAAWDRRVATSPVAKGWHVVRGAAVAGVLHAPSPPALPARPPGLFRRPL